MKKFAAFLLVMAVMTVMLGGFSMASSETMVTVYLEGEKVEFTDAQPIHTGTRVLVPVRGFFEKIGVTVDWNSGDKVVIVKDDNQEIMLEVGNSAVLNNGMVQHLDCSVISTDSRTYIPLRYVSESFGYDVKWDGKTQSVYITKKSEAGAAGSTSDLPTVDSLENIYQLLRYNIKMTDYMMYRNMGPDVMIERDWSDVAPSVAQEYSDSKSSPPMESNSAAAGKPDYSGTNNQVEGIEEGDLIKTDGKYIYIVREDMITIVDADPNSFKIVSEIDCDKGVSDIYIYGDKLMIINENSRIAFSAGNDKDDELLDWVFGESYIRTTNVKIYDIADRAKPVCVTDKDYEGRYLSSRMIDDDLYIVTNSTVRFIAENWTDELAEILLTNNKKEFIEVMKEEGSSDSSILALTGYKDLGELFDALRKGLEVYITPKYTDNKTGKVYDIGLKDIAYFKDMVRPNYMMTIGIDVNSGKDNVDAYLGSSGQLYVSAGHMYTALSGYEYNVLRSKVQRYPVYDYLTSVYRFELKDGTIKYEARGKVPGSILNQFSMDEYKENFRIATTTSGTNPGNNVYILNENMEIQGRLEGIAEDEKIYSTRFAGDRIYMVTFRQMDPFFVIDASNPKKPSVLGYLKIPGFSTYMHILDEDHVLGFGYNTEQRDGWGIDTTGFKLSLFDVSNVKKPVEIKNEIIGKQAEALVADDHKALMISLQKGIMGFPLAYINSDQDYFAGYYLYNISNKDFSYKGRVSHYPERTLMDDIEEEDMVYRGVYIGNNLYTLSMGKLQVHDLNSLKLKGSLELK